MSLRRSGNAPPFFFLRIFGPAAQEKNPAGPVQVFLFFADRAIIWKNDRME